ncbi:MAG: helix-turn-helix transcriptional regulator [bacterium]
MKKTIYSDEYTILREMLRETRERLNLSQVELGKMLGKHQPFVARIESGQRRLDVVEFIHMMRIMGVSSLSFLKKLEAKIQKPE